MTASSTKPQGAAAVSQANPGDMSSNIVRSQPEPGHRWFVRDTQSGAILGWFDHQVAHWHAHEQRQFGRDVEIGYIWRSLWQPPRAGQRTGSRTRSPKRARDRRHSA